MSSDSLSPSRQPLQPQPLCTWMSMTGWRKDEELAVVKAGNNAMSAIYTIAECSSFTRLHYMVKRHRKTFVKPFYATTQNSNCNIQIGQNGQNSLSFPSTMKFRVKFERTAAISIQFVLWQRSQSKAQMMVFHASCGCQNLIFWRK